MVRFDGIMNELWDFIVLLMVVSLMVGYYQFSLQNTLQLLHLSILKRLAHVLMNMFGIENVSIRSILITRHWFEDEVFLPVGSDAQ